MSTDPDLLQCPGALARAFEPRWAHALASGALAPIETEESVLVDAGVRFRVRRVSSLARKDAEARRRADDARARGGPVVDPFATPEPDLVVAGISATHLALWNKFPVLDRHLLVVTREYVDQEVLLDRADWTAFAACLHDVDGVGFYNGGRLAGASQPHKHLQLVPLPLAGDGPGVPMAALLASAPGAPPGEAVDVPALPFRHAFARLDAGLFDDPVAGGERLLSVYDALRDVGGVGAVAAPDGARAATPYNLLVTRRWMLLVPRRQAGLGPIGVNTLGFAGSFFVRDAGELALLRATGPMRALCEVALRR